MTPNGTPARDAVGKRPTAHRTGRVGLKYLLRDIPPALWTKAKKRAASEGHTLRYVLLGLIRGYANPSLSATPQKE